MSKLEELMKQYCPNGVERKRLGEIAIVTAGNSAPQAKELFDGGIYPFCRTSDVGRVKHSVDFSDITDCLNDAGIVGLRLFPKGSILIPKSGASTLLNNRVRLAIDSYVVSHLAVVIPNEAIVDSRFLYYAIEGFDMGDLVEDKSYPSVKSSKIASEIEIPVPPLPVQQEIVRILDKFTELEAELEAELERRKTQYEWYRDQLLTFRRDGGPDVPLLPWLQKLLDQYAPNGVGYRPLVDVCKITSGEFVRKDKQVEHGYPVYNGGTGNTGYYEQFNTEGPKVIVSARGAAGFVNYVTEPFWAGNSCHVMNIVDVSVNQRYLYHLMKCFETTIVGKRQEGTIPSVSQKQLYGMEIPVPPLPVQEAIVSVLDKFSELCTDISSGLPAEIAARQKQYGYYRDKLLAFERA